MDEPGLLDARHNVDHDAGLVDGPSQEDLPIRGLAERAGGYGIDRGIEAVGDVTESAERLDAAIHRFGRERLHVAGT